jgi:hypothetical protein
MTSALNLNAPNIFEQSLTVDEIRNASNDADKLSELNDKLYEWLDEAQGPVFTNEHKVTYLVIEVTK